MNPWHILGWIVVAVVAIPIALRVSGTLLIGLSYFAQWAENRIAYFKTRNIPPAKGQRWNQNGSILEIGQRHPKGHFSIILRTGMSTASWGETDEGWRKRVRNRKLFLVAAPSVSNGNEVR